MKVVLGGEAPQQRSSGDSEVQIQYMKSPLKHLLELKEWTVLIVCIYNLGMYQNPIWIDLGQINNKIYVYTTWKSNVIVGCKFPKKLRKRLQMQETETHASPASASDISLQHHPELCSKLLHHFLTKTDRVVGHKTGIHSVATCG